MRIKSYFTSTVDAAIAQAKLELGEDALLIESKLASPETRHLGAYEVVFGTPVAAEVPASGQSGPESSPDSQPTGVAREMQRLRGDLTKVMRLLVANSSRAAALDLSSDLPSRKPAIDASLGNETPGRPLCAALVGPAGCGKTTSIAKLAVREGLMRRRNTHLVSTDVSRIAAAEQLRILASILGVGFSLVESPAALDNVLAELERKDLILIDTPGLGPGDTEDISILAAALTGNRRVDVHLAVSAATDLRTLLHIGSRFAAFEPHKLLVTNADETESLEHIASAATTLSLAVSYISNGQCIPHDIREATALDFLPPEFSTVNASSATAKAIGASA